MSGLPPLGAGGRWRAIAALVAMGLGQAGAMALAAFSTRDAFAALRAGEQAPWGALGALAAAGFALGGLRLAERVAGERLGQRYAGALRRRLFAHVARLPGRTVAGLRAGSLTLRFVGDLSAVRGWVSGGLSRLIASGVSLAAAAGAFWLLDPAMALAASGPLAAGLGAMALAGWRLGPAHRRLRRRRARLAGDMGERLPLAPELRLMGRMEIELARLGRRTEAVIAASVARARLAALMRAIPDAASAIAAALVLWVAFRDGAAGAQVAGALALLGLMAAPMRALASVGDRYRAWVAAREKCAALLARPTLRRARPTLRAAPDGPPALSFAGYGPGGATLKVRAGQRVAIIGANGAGKSALLRVAAGLEAAPWGPVRVAGRDPTGLRAPERRRLIALVDGRAPMLAGSLRRALTMGVAAHPDDAAIVAEAGAFGLGGVLARLGGLDGAVAEGGRNLSSGEARRLTLARAALSGAGLLLLDEPDDGLDAEGGPLIARLLGRDATVLLVTHDPALARRMETVWFVEDGRVREIGAPGALLDGDGPAARFFRPRPVA
jgi:ABC-type multidrug transport system fused ATPase/permease subunit